MRRLAVAVTEVAAAAGPVFIVGETGTGKEALAWEIHRRSARAGRPLVALSCAAASGPQIESELFGHRRGAFPGALRGRRGLLEEASGGAVLLDEIGELSPDAQRRLLRVLDAGEVLPLGAQRGVAVDVRILAISQRDLTAEVKEGRFRPDLYYRLTASSIRVPPLRERREDIPRLVDHFVAGSAEARRKRVRGATPRALEALLAHDFPGNVRELRHAVEMACLLAEEEGAIDLEHLPEDIASPRSLPPAPAEEAPGPLREAVDRFERALILQAMEGAAWDRAEAARRLQVSPRTLAEKLHRHGIRDPCRSA